LTALLLISCLTSVFGATEKVILYTQDFNSASPEGVTFGDSSTMSIVSRPQDNADTSTEEFTAGDGALRIGGSAGKKAKVSFEASYQGEFVFEMDFRVDAKSSGTGAGRFKFAQLNDGMFMFTSGTFSGDGYTIRYNYVNSEGGNVNSNISSMKLAYQTWHHLKVTVNSDRGTIAMAVDDSVILAETETTKLQNFSFSSITSTNGDADGSFLIDNVTIYQEVPLSSDTTLTSSVYTVSDNGISGIAEKSTPVDVLANVTLANYASAAVYQADGTTRRTGYIETGDVVCVTAQDGTKKTYVLTVDQPAFFAFRQSFDWDLSTVTLNGFSIVEEDGDSYTPDGTKNGILKSAPGSTNSAQVTFDQAYSGNIVFTGKFKYDTKEAASGSIKFFDLYNSNKKSLVMITIGNSTDTGFNIRPVYKKTEDGANNVSPLGPSLAFGLWHTLRVELDSAAGTFDLFVDGESVVTQGYPYGGGTATDLAYVTSYHGSADHTVPFYLDEIAIAVEAPSSYSVTYTVGEGGALKRNGAVVSDSEALAADTYTYQVVPDEGYEVRTVSVASGGETLYPTLNANNEFEAAISGDTQITVEFQEKTPAKPEIITADVPVGVTQMTDDEGRQYTAYTVYATISQPESITGYGMKLSFGSESLDLPGVMTGAPWEALQNAGGKFAFRVFGEGISQKACTLTPYLDTEGERITGTPSREFTGE
ncbi:MAG: hypothetical protein SO147_04510, partial [Clostridia bacterium]|nr:hypothetical protein [Clostridia bacterium]